LPLPLLPEVMLIQVALLVAVQLQPVKVVTLTVPLPPLDVNDWLVDESVKVQGMPFWFTVKSVNDDGPDMVSDPERALVVVLAATV
jgi:hypothetical protein